MSFGAFGGDGNLFLADDGFEKEHRLQFLAPTSAGGDPILHVVFSGSVGAFSTTRSSDSADTHWNVVMVVGPFWAPGGVKQVVPHVSVGRYQNTNADEDDEQAWEILGLTWDTVNVPTTKNLFTTLEDRIRLKFMLNVRGVETAVQRFNYYAVASGLQLGQRGLDFP
jgi:hypothetical protein